MRKILVIDDDAELRARIRVALQTNGFDVTEAETVTDGVGLARKLLPDLVLSDVIMNNGDGYQVLTALREDDETASIPFILMTGEGSGPGMRLGMDLGADDYLVKPFRPEALLASVEARLDKTKTVARRWESKMDELRDCISTSLPHEFLTPLTGILSSADALRAGLDSLGREEVLGLADGIYESGLRLNDVIQKYVLYSRLVLWKSSSPQNAAAISSDQDTTQAETVVAKEARRQAKRNRRRSDLVLELTDATLFLKGDYLRSMVAELVENAFKFSKSESAVVVKTTAADAFELSVRDQGCGMSVQQVADIGAYFQFDRRLYEQQGSGLGLAIVNLLAELHGGRLSIRSAAGMGTTVSVTLPLPVGAAV